MQHGDIKVSSDDEDVRDGGDAEHSENWDVNYAHSPALRVFV